MWLVMKGDSLRSYYAQAKYFSGDFPISTARESPLWRSIVSHHEYLLDHSKWIVSRGDASFCGVKWLERRS